MAVILAMVKDFNQAEDIFEDTMLEIVNSKSTFDEKKDFLPWAKGVARNMVKRYWDSLEKGPVPENRELIERIAEIAGQDQEYDLWKTEKAALVRCMHKLSEKYRRLFLLRYGRNMKGSALAEKTGFSTKSIRSVLMRVRRTLRRCIDTFTGNTYTESSDGR